MPWFYVDDAFADSKPVMRLDRALRNEAVGLWLRCGAWSAKEETDGRVPLDVVKTFDGTPRLIRALHQQANLWAEEIPDSWQDSREILFGNWEKWQKTRAENMARRKREADKKSTYRASKKGRDYVPTSDDTEMSTGDTPGDTTGDSENVSTKDTPGESLYPDPTRPISNYSPTEEHSLNVGTERGHTDAVNPSASRLVATVIPDRFPAAVRTALRLQASQLMNGDGIDADIVADALRRWLTKPDAGPALLPSLAADVIRARAAPVNGKSHKLRSIAELAQRERVREQAELPSAHQPKGIA